MIANLDPEVFAIAAEYITQGLCMTCCSAIGYASVARSANHEVVDHYQEFSRHFRPAPRQQTAAGLWWHGIHEQSQTARVIALLLMREMVLDARRKS